MIVPATAEHCRGVVLTLPDVDKYFAMYGINSHEEGLRMELARAHEAWTWMVLDDVLAMGGYNNWFMVGAIFGLTYVNLLEPPIFWLYPTKEVANHKISFIKECLKLKDYFGQKYPQIAGYCNLRFAESERWLKWMGVRMKEPEKVGDLTMTRFTWPS